MNCVFNFIPGCELSNLGTNPVQNFTPVAKLPIWGRLEKFRRKTDLSLIPELDGRVWADALHPPDAEGAVVVRGTAGREIAVLRRRKIWENDKAVLRYRWVYIQKCKKYWNPEKNTESCPESTSLNMRGMIRKCLATKKLLKMSIWPLEAHSQLYP
jgi:hypothetical protein